MIYLSDFRDRIVALLVHMIYLSDFRDRIVALLVHMIYLSDFRDRIVALLVHMIYLSDFRDGTRRNWIGSGAPAHIPTASSTSPLTAQNWVDPSSPEGQTRLRSAWIQRFRLLFETACS